MKSPFSKAPCFLGTNTMNVWFRLRSLPTCKEVSRNICEILSNDVPSSFKELPIKLVKHEGFITRSSH